MNEQIRHYILGLMRLAGTQSNSVQKLHFKVRNERLRDFEKIPKLFLPF
jgi:hypothetical protein